MFCLKRIGVLLQKLDDALAAAEGLLLQLVDLVYGVN